MTPQPVQFSRRLSRLRQKNHGVRILIQEGSRQSGQTRHPKPDSGFTLMELMVVVAIIAILASIGLPTFRTFILKSEAAEVMEQCGAIAQAIKVYVERHQNFNAATLTTQLSPGAGQKGHLGGTAPADEITTIIPELAPRENAHFRYEIDATVLDNREIYLCVKAYKPATSGSFILYSSRASALETWSGNFYDKTYLDSAVAAVAGGYCTATGTAQAFTS